MMGNLQHLDRGQAPLQEHRVDLFLDVSGEEEPLAAERPKQDDRHVVDRGAVVGRLDGHSSPIRPQDAEGDAVQREAVAGCQSAGLRPERLKLGLPCPVAWPRSDHARLHDPAHPISHEEERQPADVILMGVGQDHEIEAAVPRRNVGIELNQQPVRVRPSVHEHPPAAVALDQDRVPLPDVQHCQVDGAVRAVRDDEDHRRDRRSQPGTDQS